MANKKRKKKSKREQEKERVDRILRGGNPVPRKLVERSVAEIAQQRAAQFEKQSTAAQRMNRYFAAAQDLAPPDHCDPRVEKAQATLLKNHERLARKRLAAPNIAGDFSGMLPGQIRATIVPPFDYDIVIPSRLGGADADLEATSNRQTGKMRLSAVSTRERVLHGGSMYTTVGIYFHPPSRGRLTVYAAPKFSYQWWTNSLRSTDIVRSFGQLALTVYGIDVASDSIGETGTIDATAGNEFFSWDETQSGQINLDFDANVQAPVLSAELNVNRTLVYMLFVSANVHVYGAGWPGSLAGSQMTVTVPYISYDFRMEQVIQPF